MVVRLDALVIFLCNVLDAGQIVQSLKAVPCSFRNSLGFRETGLASSTCACLLYMGMDLGLHLGQICGFRMMGLVGDTATKSLYDHDPYVSRRTTSRKRVDRDGPKLTQLRIALQQTLRQS